MKLLMLPAAKIGLLSFGAGLLLTGCGKPEGGTSAGVSYEHARAEFTTTLVKKGAAPQEWSAEKVPTGVSEVVYSKELGLKGWLSKKPSGKPGQKSPAVLFLHGGFAFGGGDWEAGQPYSDAGFRVFVPMLRGENGQRGEYSMFYNEVQDVEAAREYLAKLPDVDAKRIYLAGHSVGGTLVLLSAMAGDGFRAAASFSGAPDVVGWATPQPDVIPFDPKDTKEFEMRSPLYFATSFKCPTRIFFGDQEGWCREGSEKTAAAARAAGLDVQAEPVPGDHFSAVAEETRKSIAFFQTVK